MPVVPNKYRGTIEYSVVYSELIYAARCRGMVTYQELALRIGLPVEGNYMGTEIGHMLGEISEEEHGRSRPMLSSIVVGVSGHPGPGFFELARLLGKLNSTTRDDELSFWEREKDALYATWRTPMRTR